MVAVVSLKIRNRPSSPTTVTYIQRVVTTCDFRMQLNVLGCGAVRSNFASKRLSQLSRTAKISNLLDLKLSACGWAVGGGQTKLQIGCGHLIAYIWDKQHLKA